MIFYNYEEIYVAAIGDSDIILELYKDSCTKSVQENFIINPEVIVNNIWTSNRTKAEYLGLCSLRDYQDYTLNNYCHLHLDDLPPWVPLDIVKQNSLVKLTDNEIIFFNEEK